MEHLLSSHTRTGGMVLAEAVEQDHPEADTILSRLFRLRSVESAQMIAGAWNYWKQHRYAAVIRRVQNSVALRKEFLEAVAAMPLNEEGDSTVFMLWKLLDDQAIGSIIEEQQRRAPDLELDALFGLAMGDAGRYLELDDTDHLIFGKVWHSASSEQRRRIGTTVFASRNPSLIAAFDDTAGNDRNLALILETLKSSGDHDTLFNRLHGLPFTRALELLDYWEHDGGCPVEPSARETVAKALEIYRELLSMPVPAETGVPEGTRPLLDFWQSIRHNDGQLGEALAAADPFIRAGALYSAGQQGLIPCKQLLDVALNGTWPEKLVARFLVPEAVPESGKEHVCWLTDRQNLEARMMAIRLPGSIDDYHYFLDQLDKSDRSATPEIMRQRALLRILTIMQRHFLRGVITVDDSDDAPEGSAVETEDALDVTW